MRYFFIISTAIGTAFLPSQLASAYSGEDLLKGGPWHHEDITCRALNGDAYCLKIDKSKGLYADDLGFSERATHAIAWHADYIDSYIYSPILWAQAAKKGQPARSIRKRYLAGMANYWGLASLHFDDLNSTQDIQETWNRYLAGTLIGLEWAATRKMPDGSTGDVQAAYNILGLSLHANQDFYSHSTWINAPWRRNLTYLDATKRQRDATVVMTGAYEQAVAPVQHGKYSFACTAYTKAPLQSLMSLACADVVPTANLGFCEEYRECKQNNRQDARVEVAGLPTDFVVLAPPGIAMDNTSLARVGAHQRGLAVEDGLARPDRTILQKMNIDVRNPAIRDTNLGPRISSGVEAALKEAADDREMTEAKSINVRENCELIINHKQNCERDSDFLFAESKHLAVVSSKQWVRKVSTYMEKEHPGFWTKVKNCTKDCAGFFNYKNPPEKVTRSFENYQDFPFQFMSAGHDKPTAHPDKNAWYLRVEVDTANERGAGTSADIKLIGNEARGEVFLMDYLSMTDPHSPVRGVLTYDDMESGDKQVYTVGPFQDFPTNVTLFNDSSSGSERRRAIRHSIRDGIISSFESARHMFRNDQDYVGVINWDPSRAELDEIIRSGERLEFGAINLTSAPGTKFMIIDGGDEGVYQFDIKVSKTRWQGSGDYRGWAEYDIYIDKITCLRESTVDGGTAEDEPFFFAGLSSYGLNTPEFHRYGPFSNIGTNGNDRRVIEENRSFRKVRLPHGGAMMLSLEAHESDKEKPRDRTALFNKFMGSISQADMDDYPKVVAEFGRTFGGDWKVSGLRIYAFQRGNNPKYGRVFKLPNPLWIDEDARIRLQLDRSSAKSLGVDLADLSDKRSLYPQVIARGSTQEGQALPYNPKPKPKVHEIENPNIKIPNVRPKAPISKKRKKN